jgi:predicted amidohydrolase YtcJ
MFGVWAAVTRQTSDGANPKGWVPSQKISVEEALRAYTVGNAAMVGELDVSGTVSVGKRADLVILSHDPRKVAPDFLKDINVVRTLLNGQTVFEYH